MNHKYLSHSDKEKRNVSSSRSCSSVVAERFLGLRSRAGTHSFNALNEKCFNNVGCIKIALKLRNNLTLNTSTRYLAHKLYKLCNCKESATATLAKNSKLEFTLRCNFKTWMFLHSVNIANYRLSRVQQTCRPINTCKIWRSTTARHKTIHWKRLHAFKVGIPR